MRTGVFLNTVSATEWCEAYGNGTFKAWQKANEMERRRLKTSKNLKNLLIPIGKSGTENTKI